MNWLKKHYVGLSAGVIAVIALVTSVKSCNGNEDVNARVDGVEQEVTRWVDHQTKMDDIMLVNDSILEAKVNELRGRMNRAESNISDLQDSITVHREEIDSLTARVDTIAKRQAECHRKKAAKKPARHPVRPNTVPAKPDTVFVIVKEEVAKPAQQANGCGDDQNANVVINGDNNKVIISNNGAKNSVDTAKTVTRRVVATATSTLIVNTYVTRQSYCK